MAGHVADGFEDDGQVDCVPCAVGFFNPNADRAQVSFCRYGFPLPAS
jgi:hypothetical protein